MSNDEANRRLSLDPSSKALDYESPKAHSAKAGEIALGLILSLLSWGIIGILILSTYPIMGQPRNPNYFGSIGFISLIFAAVLANVYLRHRRDRSALVTGLLYGTECIGFIAVTLRLLVFFMSHG